MHILTRDSILRHSAFQLIANANNGELEALRNLNLVWCTTFNTHKATYMPARRILNRMLKLRTGQERQSRAAEAPDYLAR